LYANNRLSGIDTATTDYTLTYDIWGNVLTIKAGNYTLATYEYAANNGKLKKLTYGNGDYEEYVYDELERLVQTKLNGVTEYTVKYDANGRLYSLTENGVTHIYEYDSLDRLVRAWQEDANGETTISVENFYDSLGRPTGSAYGDVSATTQQYGISYKANSNLIDNYTMPSNKVNTYSYDEFERLTQKTHSSNVFTTQYSYVTDANGNTSSLISRMDIDSNAIDTYFTYTYDNLGNIVSVCQNGTVIESYEYDSLGQMTRANSLADNSSTFYQYDKSGNILYKFRFAYTTEATSNMPLAAADEIVAYQYTYSGWGDLLSRYGYNGALISYDEIGNPTNWRNALSLNWNARELQSVTLSDTKSLEFEYDSSGIRTKKTYVETNGNTFQHSYILDGSRIIKETVKAFPTSAPAAGTTFFLLYYYDESGVASVNYNGARYYYVKNLQGDVIGLVNASGQYVVQYVYDAWGRVVSVTGSLASTLGQYNPFLYRGYYYDYETGWYYLQSRYYDPTVARFLNADGIVGANGGIEGYNMFAYCNNNPIVFSDETGFALRSSTEIINDGARGDVLVRTDGYVTPLGIGSEDLGEHCANNLPKSDSAVYVNISYSGIYEHSDGYYDEAVAVLDLAFLTAGALTGISTPIVIAGFLTVNSVISNIETLSGEEPALKDGELYYSFSVTEQWSKIDDYGGGVYRKTTYYSTSKYVLNHTPLGENTWVLISYNWSYTAEDFVLDDWRR